MSCDDNCKFFISHEGDTLDPDQAEQVLIRTSYSEYRDKEVLDKVESNPAFGHKFSKWVTLEKGQYYYTLATLSDGGGQVNIDVGMEVKPEVMPANHPNAEKQVQQVAIAQTDIV